VPIPVRTRFVWAGVCSRHGLVALLLLIAFPVRSGAADAPVLETPAEDLIPIIPKRPKPPPPATANWAQWNDVERIRGYSECRRVEETNRLSDGGYTLTTQYQIDLATGTFLLKRARAADFSVRWVVETGKIAGSHHAVSTSDDAGYHGRSGSDATISGPSTNFGFEVDTKGGKWDFYAYGKLLQPYTNTFWISSRKMVGGPWKIVDDAGSELKTESAHFSTKGDLPVGPPGLIRGAWDYAHGTLRDGKSDYHAIVMLAPEYKDLELVVEIEGVNADGTKVSYDKWVPRGTVTGAAGSRLKIKARLQAEDGGAVKAKVENFTFSLMDTSSEPGICMNYPRVAVSNSGKPPAPDLKFAPTGPIDADRQELEMPPVMDDPGHPHAEARVDCYDFGGWSNLYVAAELKDGRTIVGHLKGDPIAILMPLPKRTGGSYIADAWKEERGITAGDEDDSEKSPSAGKAPGDGFTLYEEYRGFVENGKHLEGDPKKIDFFVRNFIGGDARPGIDLFANLTGAEVHDRLRDAEFDPEKRVMNANHAQGAHRVDQHGVYLRTQAGLDGAKAMFTTAAMRGRPVTCLEIRVQPREAPTPTFTTENVPASDLIFAYDMAIAHELLHAVGVEHHGEGDGPLRLHFMFTDDDRNTKGKPFFYIGYYGYMVGEVPITDEATGRSLAALLEPDLMLKREESRPHGAGYIESFWKSQMPQSDLAAHPREFQESIEKLVEEGLNNSISDKQWWVGVEHGACSGVEGCVMRYFFAQLYEKQGAGMGYYYISKKHTEHIGFALCHSITGTGINLSTRKPQSRYGDSYSGWGDCADWMVFNDSAPLEPAPKKPAPKKK
jgi:hypothetical protein